MATKSPKTKPIDLGLLQDRYEVATKQIKATSKALQKAQEAHGKAKADFASTHDALQEATRTVLG